MTDREKEIRAFLADIDDEPNPKEQNNIYFRDCKHILQLLDEERANSPEALALEHPGGTTALRLRILSLETALGVCEGAIRDAIHKRSLSDCYVPELWKEALASIEKLKKGAGNG